MADSNLAGKTVVITGCTAGIGKANLHHMVPKKPARIIMVNRNRQKTDDVIASLKTAFPTETQTIQFDVVIADLSEPTQVFRACDEIKALDCPIHILISNAGIFHAQMDKYGKERTLNSEGHEKHFATNYLSMCIICSELRELLMKSSGVSDGGAPSRIVITGSFTSMEMIKGEYSFDNLQGETHFQTKKPQFANDIMYPQSKLLQYGWARQFASLAAAGDGGGENQKLHVIVYCPGAVNTDIEVVQELRKNYSWIMPVLNFFSLFRDPMVAGEVGAWCADVSHERLTEWESANGESGLYIDVGKSGAVTKKLEKVKGCKLDYYPTFKKSSPATADSGNCEKLWEITDEIMKEMRKKA